MSYKIPIPTPKNTDSQRHPAHHPKLSTYCYIKADEDHYDLQDLFGGKYIKSQEIWRFPKNLEQQVHNFLDCSSTESEESDNDINTNSDHDQMIVQSNPDIRTSEEDKVNPNSAEGVGDSLRAKKRRDRLHRANSFNASDDSNDECDSLDEKYRRRRQPIEKVLVESNKLKKEADKY
jgi:hypothetical protein